MNDRTKTKLVKPKTKKGERVLKEREPQLVETVKKILLLYGNRPSPIVKDVLTDIHKLQPGETVKFSRKNSEILPFEAGGEVKLEQYASKADCGQFVLGNHTKKRPHNLIIGRLYDGRMYDLIELGIEKFQSIKAFGAASAAVQTRNKPCFVFAGEQFEHDPEFKQAKGMLLDLLKGRVVEGLNLMGVDHIIFVTAQDRILYLRQYAVRLKKSGTKVPRIELVEMGPSLDLKLRRTRLPDSQIEKEAHKQASLAKKKEKNVESDMLEGKVGRIYMPKQSIESMPQHKMKSLKRGSSEGKTAGTKQKRSKADRP